GTAGFERQHALLSLRTEIGISTIGEAMANNRKLFIPTPIDMDDGYRKTNIFEAKAVVETIKACKALFELNGITRSIGVITPYRAQIALIREQLQLQGLHPDDFTVDTVERYQGGARDVIILSLCLNTDTQLLSLMSLSEDGTDRKLNVALTRAREHLIIIGNPELMSQNAVYRKLLDWLGEGVHLESLSEKQEKI
ncbi:MAG: hypothetical protein KDC24_13070, partial [Saprospiraceae bacterium]|nr:hypothetical protein [Saprospiraceae bacterium]